MSEDSPLGAGRPIPETQARRAGHRAQTLGFLVGCAALVVPTLVGLIGLRTADGCSQGLLSWLVPVSYGAGGIATLVVSTRLSLGRAARWAMRAFGVIVLLLGLASIVLYLALLLACGTGAL